MEEETIIQEQHPQPKYALLTFGEYFKLNHALSVAKGWQLGQNTERALPIIGDVAKVNIVLDVDGNEVSYDKKLAIRISSSVQINYPSVIEGIELYDTFSHCDDDVADWIAEGLNTAEIDWNLIHSAALNVADKVIWCESEPRTTESDAAVEKLNGLGTIIITPDETT